MISKELAGQICESLELLSDLIRGLDAGNRPAEPDDEESRADGRRWGKAKPGQLHGPNLAAENSKRIGELIVELELMREGLEFGELRSAYNGAIDRLRLLESVLSRSR